MGVTQRHSTARAAAYDDLGALRERGSGTAMVAGVDVGMGETRLRLRYPDQEVHLRIGSAPRVQDYDPRPDIRRPLAVRVIVGEQVRCRLLGVGQRGPQTVDITLGEALAYADVGINTVVLTD